ncbi:transporter substrate-binding domain-containing protein [Endozoicomonas sp. SM1973]|uniref:Transporter substrate-binding domain-containing protein n=1 Tax=Spartinivicinus marinus TaxID=2994442 RepID=A0A853I1L5_9GAMM|nr:transporter substrate-binding domain-containing protein [Spartinivicinus marinus]MCX4025439.1 transporter substrate-binding domain-containing protein [Spartinivicinus marinus]NYZ65332.1 transporter substrate-binding domain-containing protein [Spartinivicinus marinus]
MLCPSPQQILQHRLVCLIVVLTLISISSQSVAHCSRIKVSGNPEYPPLLWRDRTNPKQLTGVSIALLKRAVEGLDIAIDAIYVGPWSRAQAKIKANELDMLAGAFLTVERTTYMEYVKPAYTQVANVVFVANGKGFKFKRWSDLKNKRGATLINNSFGQKFDQYAQDHLALYGVRSLEIAFKLLLAKRADYVVYELYPGLAYAKAMGINQEIRHFTNYINSEPLYYTFALKSPCLENNLTKHLSDFIQSQKNTRLEKELLEEYLQLWQNQAHLALDAPP